MWRPLEHTADAGLEVEAGSWQELCAEAARAFGEWSSGGRLPADGPGVERRIEVRGVDRIDLWVRWWRELHRLWTVEGHLALRAQVEADEHVLTARVHCLSSASLDPAHCLDVKAVTWHAAHVTREQERWVGTIVLDL